MKVNKNYKINRINKYEVEQIRFNFKCYVDLVKNLGSSNRDKSDLVMELEENLRKLDQLIETVEGLDHLIVGLSNQHNFIFKNDLDLNKE